MERIPSRRAWQILLAATSLPVALNAALWLPILVGLGCVLLRWGARPARYGLYGALVGLVLLPMLLGGGIWCREMARHSVARDPAWALSVSLGATSMACWTAECLPLLLSSCWWIGAVAGWVVDDRTGVPGCGSIPAEV